MPVAGDTAMKTMQLSEARNLFAKLPEELAASQETLTVTRRGKPVLAVLPFDAYQALMETLEIVGDEQAAKALAEGIRQAESGEVVAWESAKKRLAL